MKIKKFIESYQRVDDVADEYSKQILSKYIDDLNDNKKIEDAFSDITKNLESYQEYQVCENLRYLINNIKKETDEYFEKLKIKKETDRYNL